MTANTPESLPAERPAAPSVAVVVNGNECQPRYAPDETVASFVMRTVHLEGYDPTRAEWELRDSQGVRYPDHITMREALLLFLSPRPGEGA